MTFSDYSTEEKWVDGRDFEDVLYKLRWSADQIELQNTQIRLIRRSWFWVVFFGTLLTAAASALLLEARWWIVVAFAVASFAALSEATKYATEARHVAKDQDRRYFLASIRAARSIEELNAAELFAFLKHRTGDEVLVDREVEVTRLREALSQHSELFFDLQTKPRPYDATEQERAKREVEYLAGKGR